MNSEIIQIIMMFGIPSAITGIAVWLFKRQIEANERKHQEHQNNLEELVLMMLQSTRANSILCKATAEAVRDGHCNGNISNAIAAVDKVAAEEKEFLLRKSIRYIFE